MDKRQAIEKKLTELQQQGVTVGTSRSELRDTSFDGAVQDFTGGSIYWHPHTGAHFLSTGPVLDTYTQLQGPGVDPETFRRPFGYPVADVSRDPGRDFEFAEFQWGSIYRVASRFVLAIHQSLAADLPKLGLPLFVTPSFGAAGSTANASLQLPSISADDHAEVADATIATIEDLWKGRIALEAVDRPGEFVDLIVRVEVNTSSPQHSGLRQRATLPGGVSLRDRTLYNIVLRGRTGGVVTIAPHSVYCRANWEQFSLIHATDLHVGERFDDYQGRLAEERPEAARFFMNTNDSFRNLIRYANKLHRKGALDLLLLTGDLVDYQFENHHDRNGGGNFELFERIVLGQAPSTTGVPVEELLVPIAMTLGNHDYRTDPYALDFTFGIPHLKEIHVTNYEPMNITRGDAHFLQRSNGTSEKSLNSAQKMVDIGLPKYALRRLCAPEAASEASYVLELGSHRIVVLDSKHDIGRVGGSIGLPVVSQLQDILIGILADTFGSEDQASFIGGSPNLKGIERTHLRMTSRALREAGERGVVIVAVHGPCLNLAGSDFPHFLRETEHAVAEAADIQGFLVRRNVARVQPNSTIDFSAAQAWIQALGKPFFNIGASEQLLDVDGVSKGHLKDLLRLAAGGPDADGKRLRPVDVVLSGHGHFRTEFRIRWNDKIDGGQYFMDFYTENPSRYYATRQNSVDHARDLVHVYVSQGAPAKGKAVARELGTQRFSVLDVPPYPEPLNESDRKRQWWNAHRPLLLETGALGPIESRSNTRERDLAGLPPDASFTGFRVLTIEGPTIHSIRYVRFPQLLQNGLTMPWERTTVLAYDRNRGVGEVYVAEKKGKLRLLARHENLRRSWSHIVRGDFGGRGLIDALFYDADGRTMEFWEFSADGSMRLLAAHEKLPSTWTHIVPVHNRRGGTSSVLFYDRKTKASHGCVTMDGGAMRLSAVPDDFGAASHLVAIDATGDLFSTILTYNDEEGSAQVRIPRSPATFTDWRKGWSHIVPGRFGGHGFTDLLLYQASTGVAEFYAMNGEGGIDLLRSHTGWPQIVPVLQNPKSDSTQADSDSAKVNVLPKTDTVSPKRRFWTHIVVGNFGGNQQSDLLLYESSTGAAQIWSVNRAGDMRQLSTLLNWGPWTHVVS